ncbi:hypothetical protein AFB00_02455 [Pseudonocardia sp. HH130630-07]|nr:hypothetical protein AFB00_02455 [Pseudonocardia sp. HH130630-07]
MLAAARDLGFFDLTVGAVTARVGVKYSTFYRHFPSLEALVAALVDDVVTEDAFPDSGGDWRAQLLEFAASTFDVMAANPGLTPALARLPDAPETMMAAFRRVTDRLLEAGFTGEDSVLAASTAMHVSVQPWLTANARGTGDVRRAEQVLQSPQGFAPEVLAVFRDGIDDPPRNWTLRRVELLIAGLETRLTS